MYYKRECNSQWHGPGTVIGQVGKQILVKHGSVYVSVNACRITHAIDLPVEKYRIIGASCIFILLKSYYSNSSWQSSE